MALDRDDVAARATAARAALLSLCEALSALVPVAPASGAPAPLPGAPLAALAPETPAAYPNAGVTVGPGVRRAPSPAATTAAWVPSVGDVVTTTEDPTGPIVVTRDGLDPFAATPHFHAVNLADVRHGSPGSGQGLYILSRATYSRPATSSERAAAGLPVEGAKESAVDRVALAKVLWEASREVTPAATRARPWGEATEVGRRQSLAAADAAIAFMAKAPAFDEAQEREAARVVVDRQGVRFGPYCWVSHDTIMRCDADTEAGREAFYRDRVIPKQYMAWVNAMLAAEGAVVGSDATAPECNEAWERDAFREWARTAVNPHDPLCAWLARARVAAKGGAS